MEASAIKSPSLNFAINPNPSSDSHSHSPTFLNGFVSASSPSPLPQGIEISDIEMVAMQSVGYTSLKDLLPASPPGIMSPTTHYSSWHENIPIKNPLVKHAALAYLQPMSTPPEVGDKGFFRRIKDKCCAGGFGCLAWLGEVVSRTVRDAFGDARDRNGFENGDDEDDDDEDDDEYVKVD